MALALETGKSDQAISIAQDRHPERNLPLGPGQRLDALRPRAGPAAGHWDDAVRALRTAEDIFPIKLRRD